MGIWSGCIVVDGEWIVVDLVIWFGSWDWFWGIWLVGELELVGWFVDLFFEGMWWLYVLLVFDDFVVVLII